ncbi:unnamed protein product, partial [Prorocentrum cordatum]
MPGAAVRRVLQQEDDESDFDDDYDDLDDAAAHAAARAAERAARRALREAPHGGYPSRLLAPPEPLSPPHLPGGGGPAPFDLGTGLFSPRAFHSLVHSQLHGEMALSALGIGRGPFDQMGLSMQQDGLLLDFLNVLAAEDDADLRTAIRRSADEAYSGGFGAPPADEAALARSTS